IFANNTGTLGGALDLQDTATVRGSTIAQNSVVVDGGGVAVEDAAVVTIESSTIASNKADRFAGGVLVLGSGALTLHNSLLADNEAVDDFADIVGQPSATVSARFNLIEESAAGAINGADVGNVFSQDPQIGFAPDGSYLIFPTSPIIDAGDPDPT